MPRDGSGTRERLLREAERVFARRGVHAATMREITEAAGQRNVSALTYHFGSREGVLWAILQRHNDPVDAERAELLVEPAEAMPTRDLVAALLVAYASRLRTDEGRDYLRVMAQLTDLFPTWREGALSPPHLRRILGILEARGGDEPAVRRDRVINVVMLITSAFAERARLIDEGGEPALDEPAFLANLADMLVAGLEAPNGPRLGAILVPAGGRS
jgi:TetR/AcrR family transcriptional regulator, regulator of cefoperazone and chloramphenicol sensitivity